MTGVVYALALGYRTDYLGHYLAGFAGTLMLLSLLIAIGPNVPLTLGAGLFAIALGWGTEATVFKLAIFDPVDFSNQSLGALLAVCVVLGEPKSVRNGTGLLLVSMIGMYGGFYFAFL